MGDEKYWIHGMSEAAVLAYRSGLVPASKIKGVPASLVHKYCIPKETHITSGYFNKTDFYSPYEVRAVFGLEKHRGVQPDPRAIQALEEWKAARKKPRHEILENCVVEWVEYLGRQHYPPAITHREKDARVEIVGDMATVTFQNGNTLRKRISARGFRFWAAKAPVPQQLSLLPDPKKPAK